METFAIWIIAKRTRQLLQHPSPYKKQLRTLVANLEQLFWNSKVRALEEYGNRIAYGRVIAEMKRKRDILRREGRPITFEELRAEYQGSINARTSELLERLVDENILRPDTDTPQSFRMVGRSLFRMLPVFKWLILEVLILGIVVVVLANLASEYLIRQLFNAA